MENFIAISKLLFAEAAFWSVIFTVFVAGLVRGFAGFGTGMIIFPVIAALYSPPIALVAILLLDSWPNIPVVWQCRKQVDWSELLPVVAGAAIILPLGIAFLKYGDPDTLRWFVSIIITLFVILILRGWYYKGPRNIPISMIVGGMCGFLGGSTALTGPPAIMYWMARRSGAGIVRANMTTFLFLTGFFSLTGAYVADLLSWKAATMGILASPFYLVGQLIGSHLFGLASDRIYRLVAITLILCVAITASPALDNILR